MKIRPPFKDTVFLSADSVDEFVGVERYGQKGEADLTMSVRADHGIISIYHDEDRQLVSVSIACNGDTHRILAGGLVVMSVPAYWRKIAMTPILGIPS